MRVAVTGARGFVGGYVISDLAAAGHEAVPLGRDEDGSLTRVDCVTGEALDNDTDLTGLLEGVTAVVHLAARTVDSLATPLASYLGPNVALTEELVAAAAAAGAHRFVLASSRLVYPGHLRGPIGEDCPDPPDTFYGLSKQMAESVLTLYAARTGISTVALRLAQIVGPGDGGRGALPRLVQQGLAGGPLTIAGSGAMIRDFVDVRDVVRAVTLAVEQPAPPPVANIGTGGFSVLDMAVEVANQCGLAADAIVHQDVEPEDTSQYRLDCSAAADSLGWTPERGLPEMVRDRIGSSPDGGADD